MFKDKLYLYWLIDQYSHDKISATEFSNRYYESYDLEIDFDKLSPIEHCAFRGLSQIAHRVSELENDHKLYPGVYFTADELKQKAIQTKGNLKKSWPISYDKVA